MNSVLTASERAHMARLKMMACAVCEAGPPVEAHHIVQGQTYTCIPLCADCHTGSHNGIHGRRSMWNITKKTEMSCLNDTVRRLLS